MSVISDFLKRRSMGNIKEKEWEEDDKIHSRIEIKKKSHYERELLKVLERERQESIKEALRLENRRRLAEERLIGRNMMKSDVNLLR